MNKRKIMTLALTVCMVAILAIGGSLAYLTDTDAAKNVMTVGNVKIVQNEQQRTIDDEIDNDRQYQDIRVTDDGLEDFENGKKLVPYVGNPNDGYDSTLPVYENCQVFNTADNAVDKIVTVTNTGTEEAYIRTLFAFEMEKIVDEEGNVTYQCPAASKYNRLGLVAQTGGNKIVLKGDTDTETEVVIEIDGVKYRVAEYYYMNDSKLASGATSHPSLTQFYLNPSVGNEWYDHVGPEYDILVLSQAVQTQGFSDAATALNTVFGDINEMWTTEEGKAELTEWFKACK